MNKDRMKGTIDEVVGSAKRKAGELTGSTKLQVEGMAQQVKGKVENAWGKTKDVVRDAMENTEVHADAHIKVDVKKPTPLRPEYPQDKAGTWTSIPLSAFDAECSVCVGMKPNAREDPQCSIQTHWFAAAGCRYSRC